MVCGPMSECTKKTVLKREKQPAGAYLRLRRSVPALLRRARSGAAAP